ncbi:MAG: hypothetical protein QOD26_1028 [Betaproteobacteria bacterium]|jgi:hypothetical protein|nr:hypothetical protein [Betaproteobacteria bacterium]
MGFRFSKRFRILPGVRVNVSKSGVSTSVGPKGLSVNLRDDAVRTTASIPGTGVSYSRTAKKGGSGSAVILIVIVFFGIWLLFF